jgi:hypothetical protein
MKHTVVRWNPATSEHFCPKCGRTSDATSAADAQESLDQYDCKIPAVEAPSSEPGMKTARLNRKSYKASRLVNEVRMICPEQQRLFTEESDIWGAYRIMESSNPNSPDLKELSKKAGDASHQLRLHVDTCLRCRKRKDPDVPVAVPNP